MRTRREIPQPPQETLHPPQGVQEPHCPVATGVTIGSSVVVCHVGSSVVVASGVVVVRTVVVVVVGVVGGVVVVEGASPSGKIQRCSL